MIETIIDLTQRHLIDQEFIIKAYFYINPSALIEDAKVIFNGEMYKIIDWSCTTIEDDYKNRYTMITLSKLIVIK